MLLHTSNHSFEEKEKDKEQKTEKIFGWLLPLYIEDRPLTPRKIEWL